MSTGIVLFFIGVLSAAGPRPSEATLAIRQEWGQLPMDISSYDGLLAVDNCELIGMDATMYAGGEVFNMLIYDCASQNGTQYFSDTNADTPWLLAADCSWDFWETHPDLIGTFVRIEVQTN